MQREIIGVGRLIRVRGVDVGEFAIVLSDKFQRQGLGTRLLQLLVQVGKQEGLKKIFGEILQDNLGMLRVAKKVGFTARFDQFTEVMHAEINL
jgi:acetyltransferase